MNLDFAPERACIVIPAFDAAKSVAAVIEGLRRTIPEVSEIVVVDDGSTDETARVAAEAGARVISHRVNMGKGAALATGLEDARKGGMRVMLVVDADGQHPPASARTVLLASTSASELVLGVRSLAAAGAPRANQISNGISNFFLSGFTRKKLADTQCGLRRYPVEETVALGVRAHGYAFEAEVLLRAVAAGIAIVEVPIAVYYPPEHERVTHFDSVKDPARIVAVVVRTLADLRLRGTRRKPVQD